MVRTEKVKIYKITELKEEAKTKALKWYQNEIVPHLIDDILSDDIYNFLDDKFYTLKEEKIIEDIELTKNRNNRNDLYYDLSYSGSDGLAFGCRVEYKGAVIHIATSKGRDCQYASDTYVERVDYSNEDMSILDDIENMDEHADMEDIIASKYLELGEECLELMQGIMHDAQKFGYSVIEYYWKDENCIDDMIENEYEFKVNGEKW